MKWLLLVRAKAERDISAARDWYDRQRPGLGDEFLNAVATGINEIASDPELPRLYYRNFRRVLLKRFPYKVFYQVIGPRVIVFRVLHGKQKHHSGLA